MGSNRGQPRHVAPSRTLLAIMYVVALAPGCKPRPFSHPCPPTFSFSPTRRPDFGPKSDFELVDWQVCAASAATSRAAVEKRLIISVPKPWAPIENPHEGNASIDYYLLTQQNGGWRKDVLPGGVDCPLPDEYRDCHIQELMDSHELDMDIAVDRERVAVASKKRDGSGWIAYLNPTGAPDIRQTPGPYSPKEILARYPVTIPGPGAHSCPRAFSLTPSRKPDFGLKSRLELVDWQVCAASPATPIAVLEKELTIAIPKASAADPAAGKAQIDYNLLTFQNGRWRKDLLEAGNFCLQPHADDYRACGVQQDMDIPELEFDLATDRNRVAIVRKLPVAYQTGWIAYLRPTGPPSVHEVLGESPQEILAREPVNEPPPKSVHDPAALPQGKDESRNHSKTRDLFR